VTKATCSVDGCERPHSCRGYCAMHYQRWRVNGTVEAVPRARKYGPVCTVDGCEAKHYSRGWCQKHYERWSDKGTVDDAAFQAYGQTGCKVEGCEAAHFQRGYCMKHAYRMRAWGTTDDRPSICTVDGCDRKPFSKGEYVGLCRRHAERMRLNGTTDDPRPGLRERFLAKIEVSESGCWLWTGSRNEDGYPQIMLNGRPRKAYRIAYELFVGAIADGLEIDHACHSRDLTCPGGLACVHRRCVNPDPLHLEPVTRDENIRRAWVNRKARDAAA
jgi:hypothetical protein